MARIDLTETDMDDWRDAVLFGTGPLGAYTPDPDQIDDPAVETEATRCMRQILMAPVDPAMGPRHIRALWTGQPPETPPAIPASAAPPPIAWQGCAPSRAVQAVKVGLTALAVVFAVGLLGAWLA